MAEKNHFRDVFAGIIVRAGWQRTQRIVALTEKRQGKSGRS